MLVRLRRHWQRMIAEFWLILEADSDSAMRARGQHRDNDNNDNDDYDETGLDGIDDGGMVTTTTTNATTEAGDDLYFDNNVITTSAQTACLRSISRTTSTLSLKLMSAKKWTTPIGLVGRCRVRALMMKDHHSQ